MIQQIFNLYSKLIQYNNKNLLLFIVVLIVLYNYGYITEGRIIIFSVIIIWICLYKIICRKIKESEVVYNENLLYILLWIDYLKLFIINALIVMSIKTYELKMTYKNKKIINKLILIFENLTINPLLMILNKFYNVLYIWKTTPIFEIFFKRIYGSLLGILIFSNIIGYLWYLMNYSVLNVYILVIVLNCIDEIVKSGKYSEYKIIRHLEFVNYFNLNKDLLQIIEYRSNTSLFSLYIQKILKKSNFDNVKIKIKKFAFIIHLYFKQSLDDVNIIQFNKTLKQNKLNQLKINKNFETLFDFFYFDIVTLLEDYLILLSQIEYVKIKIKKDKKFKGSFSNYELYRLDDLDNYSLLVVKMLLYYLWDFENINKDKYDFSNLMIDESCGVFNLEYIWDLSTRYSKEVKAFEIQKNYFFYEQFYLYANFVSIVDVNNCNKKQTASIDFGYYKKIEDYATKFLNNLIIVNNKFKRFYGIELDVERANEMDESIEQEVLNRLKEYKLNFIEEWKVSKRQTVEEANLQRLRNLNEYVELKLKASKW